MGCGGSKKHDRDSDADYDEENEEQQGLVAKDKEQEEAVAMAADTEGEDGEDEDEDGEKQPNGAITIEEDSPANKATPSIQVDCSEIIVTVTDENNDVTKTTEIQETRVVAATEAANAPSADTPHTKGRLTARVWWGWG